LLNNEKINIETILKNKIIHKILGNKNLTKRENCIELCKNFMTEKEYNNLVNNILKNDCEQI
jgi:hypothetical protein